MSRVRTLVASAFMGLILLSPGAASADLLGSLKKTMNSMFDTNPDSADAMLGTDEVIAGLKEALDTGTRRAVEGLGREGGFQNDASVRIPMPKFLEKARPLLETFGQEHFVDEVETTLNRAAERAVPEAAAIFGDAIRQMSFADAQGILEGPDDAATQYFKRTADGALSRAMKPIVSDATQQVGTTSAYKSLVDRASKFIDTDAFDLDQYVTDKAVAGLFLKLADEERKIREEPLSRTTDLLKRVFGS